MLYIWEVIHFVLANITVFLILNIQTVIHRIILAFRPPNVF